MQFVAVAVDFDGTLAEQGTVSDATLAAVERLSASGRKLILVTGRMLDELLEVFPQAGLCASIVAENGAVLYRPPTRERVRLGPAAPEALVEALAARGIEPLAVGESIIATLRPHEVTALEVIRDLGLEHQLVFNRESVMLLPPGVNKATGLKAALDELRFSPHNVVAIGDSENDHALLQAVECGVAVANAVPPLREMADLVTRGAAGDGVTEVIDALLHDDLAAVAGRAARHRLLLGSMRDGSSLSIRPTGENVLIAGSSGSGKSTLATGLLERLAERNYQICVIDPEGDYEAFRGAVVFGTAQRGPTAEEIVTALERPDAQVVVNLIGLPLHDRPAFFLALLPRLQEWRAKTGRPHRIVVDEAHHLVPPAWQPTPTVWARQLAGMVFITVHPELVSPLVLRSIDVAVALGDKPDRTLHAYAAHAGRLPPPAVTRELDAGEALAWGGEPDLPPRRFRVAPAAGERRRHRRKYAEGELPPDRSFYFRGPHGRLNLRAHNLIVFRQLAAGVDDATWLFHLRQGDYSRWMQEAIKDPLLAQAVQEVERSSQSAEESRRLVAHAIEARYILPAAS